MEEDVENVIQGMISSVNEIILGENLTEEAKNIGAINCIFKNEKNVIMGTNTDGEASLISYKKNFGDINNKSILLLGLGGAGKAVLNYFLKEITQGKMYVSTFNESKYKFYENFKNDNLNAARTLKNIYSRNYREN